MIQFMLNEEIRLGQSGTGGILADAGGSAYRFEGKGIGIKRKRKMMKKREGWK